jgi:putative peptidoglycan lipid II flippase
METDAVAPQIEAARDTLDKRQFKATIQLSVFSGLGLLLRLAVQMVLAYHFGARDEVDAYLVALAIPAVLQATLEFAINSVLIPLYLNHKPTDRTASQAALLDTNFSAILSLLLVLLACGPALTRPMLKIVMSGLPANTLELAVQLSPVLWLTMAGYVLYALFSSVLQANRAYVLQGVAPLLAPLVTLVCTWTLTRSIGIWAYAVGGMLGCFAQVLILIPRVWCLWRIRLAIQWPYLTRTLGLSWPLLASGLLVRAAPLLERSAASDLPVGSISHFGYAYKVIGYLLMITISGFSVVLFPSLSSLSGEMLKFRKLLMDALYAVLFAFTPVLVIFLLLADLIVRVFLVRGSFGLSDSTAVSRAIIMYGPYALFAAVGSVISRGLYALQLTKLATFLDVLGIGCYGLLLFAGERLLGVDGIPLALSAYYGAFTLLAGWVLLHRVHAVRSDLRPQSLAKIILAMGGLTATIIVIRAWLVGAHVLVTLLSASGCGLLIYLALCYALHVPEMLRLVPHAKRLLWVNARK